MLIFIGRDLIGFHLKELLTIYSEEFGHEPVDLG